MSDEKEKCPRCGGELKEYAEFGFGPICPECYAEECGVTYEEMKGGQ